MTHGLELTEFQIGGIIYCWKAKVKQKIIAQVIGCSEAIVCNIINRYKKAHEATLDQEREHRQKNQLLLKFTAT